MLSKTMRQDYSTHIHFSTENLLIGHSAKKKLPIEGDYMPLTVKKMKQQTFLRFEIRFHILSRCVKRISRFFQLLYPCIVQFTAFLQTKTPQTQRGENFKVLVPGALQKHAICKSDKPAENLTREFFFCNITVVSKITKVA